MSRSRRTAPSRSAAEPRSAEGPRSAGLLLALLALFVGVALWQVAPAFDGEFISDDFLYIVNNAYVHGLSWENVRVLLDPGGQPTAYTLNYAPVHLLLHAAEYELFGPHEMLGWHVVNAVAHGLTSMLLVAFFLRAGIPRAAAAFGGALFLVHPANVETVAWIFQLKTIVALALSLGALLLLERRPGASAVMFALALLTKITSLFALPVAVVQMWARRRDGALPRWGWLLTWAAIAMAISITEMRAFQIQADARLVIDPDPWVHARTVVAIAMRYLVMAATSWGVSTFQEPDVARSWLDLWWLGGLVALGGLGWRMVVTLWRRDEEAAFWVLAAASFAPISQVFPFIYPMGDRYLYPILPGLIGGVLLAARAPAAWLQAHAGERANVLRTTAAALAVMLVVTFSIRSERRASVFRSNMATMIDAAINYPDGLQASLLRGHRAAAEGNAPAAARAFERAIELGFSDLQALLVNPSLAGVRDHPAFQQVLRDMAAGDIARLESRENPGQSELMSLGLAYRVRGERESAIRAYERALASEGPFAEYIRGELAALRRNPNGSGG